MENIKERSLEAHYNWQGKIEVEANVPLNDAQDLALAYTPGVADACLKIKDNVLESFRLTRRWNTVPVITDGTAVLGLGDIGPEAGLPVMEGKAALFKTFGDVDAYPLCINSKETEEIIRTIKLLSGSWGGINLEDISAPRCFEIERRLEEELDIPVFHDDQHGTAIVTGAALINALKLAKKKINKIKIVINGAGAAGISICRYLLQMGAKDITICDSKGIIELSRKNLNPEKISIAKVTNKAKLRGKLDVAMAGADVFIGVSGPDCVTPEMVKSMNEKPILFTMANPIPEINPELAKEAGAYIIGTGSSQYPNQVNNALVFPGLFRGAIDSRAKRINMDMQIAASYAIANYVKPEELNEEHILPYAYDKGAHEAVAKAVCDAAIKSVAYLKLNLNK